MSVFRRLLTLLFPLRDSEHLVEKTGADGLFAKALPHTFELSGTSAVGLLPYKDEAVRAFVLEAKFHKSVMAQEALGAVLADYLMERVADETALGTTLVLVPVPLSTRRLKERGYNQTERICRAALGALGDSVLLMSDALSRVRDTQPQTSLSSDQRRINMLGAFLAKKHLNPTYSYIVVDDVMTTAATLLAAVDALRIGGAHKVAAIALAH